METDIVVIGGGQSGLALGYFLRRINRSFVILDAGSQPGGAWVHGWESLRLFSPAEASSLPGWPMSRPANVASAIDFPTRDYVIDYLRAYETRYQFPMYRPVTVVQVDRTGTGYLVRTTAGEWRTKVVVGATGSWIHPYVANYPGDYEGIQIHSAQYQSPDQLIGKKVLVVGGGNSGAQILAEVSRVAQTTWVTLTEPTFLPDDVDGRVLFQRASQQYQASVSGTTTFAGRLGDIVMVPSVQEARTRDVLHSVRPFAQLTQKGVIWPDGRTEDFDAIIWCTGFKPATDYLRSLGIVDADGRVATEGTKAINEPGLWLVGYGSWTGFASATLIGVGRSARATAEEISVYLKTVSSTMA